jgi:hypothetical protein
MNINKIYSNKKIQKKKKKKLSKKLIPKISHLIIYNKKISLNPNNKNYKISIISPSHH